MMRWRRLRYATYFLVLYKSVAIKRRRNRRFTYSTKKTRSMAAPTMSFSDDETFVVFEDSKDSEDVAKSTSTAISDTTETVTEEMEVTRVVEGEVVGKS